MPGKVFPATIFVLLPCLYILFVILSEESDFWDASGRSRARFRASEAGEESERFRLPDASESRTLGGMNDPEISFLNAFSTNVTILNALFQ